jgi:Zn finger protein HypA/HybF involved in hydrogenase expression
VHEYGLVEQVVATVLAKLQEPGTCQEGSAMEVVLRVGMLEMHSEAAVRQAYEVLTKGTPLEDSRLTLEILPATLACPGCGFQGDLGPDQVDPHEIMPLTECPQCQALSQVLGGRGVESIHLICD